MSKTLLFLFLFTFNLTGYTWNAAGHKLIAQIAYDKLSPEARQMCADIFNIQGTVALQIYFVESSTWLDRIRRKHVHYFDEFHYVDIPFSRDGTPPPKEKKKNALTAIPKAILQLSSPSVNNKTKALNLKILIHVVGDIHQPLHTITKVSRRFPEGDLGGNLYLLKSPYGKNLHQYWDKGAGVLTYKTFLAIKIKAYLLEKKWPCTYANELKEPKDWVNASHNLAVTHAYSIRTHKKPSKPYQDNTIAIVDQQIAFAGCRLANLLNSIARIAE